MRTTALTLLILLVGVIIVPGQPKDGDLIVTFGYADQSNGGTMVLNPTTGKVTSLHPSLPGIVHTWVRMDSANGNYIVGGVHGKNLTPGYIVNVCAVGCLSILARMPGCFPNGFELDLDRAWIIAGTSLKTNYLWSIHQKKLATLFTTPGSGGWTDAFNDVAIDRRNGAPPYVLAVWQSSATLSTPRLLHADSSGIVTTLVSGTGDPLLRLTCVELEPTSGDYLATGEGAGGALYLVNRSGGVRTLTTGITHVQSARYNQDGTAWILSSSPTGPANSLFKIDRAGNVITMITIKGLPTPFLSTGVEVYGRRRLVAYGSGRPGTTINIRLQSRRIGDQRKSIALACSMARRPSIVFPGGERLNLGVDSLFLASAQGQMASIFQSFQGQTDSYGNANAWVNIPNTVPPGLGLLVFVAGIVYDSTGVLTVTNTHWFELT